MKEADVKSARPAAPDAMKAQGERHLREFALVLVVVLSIFTVVAFHVIAQRTGVTVRNTVLEQARAYANLIETARVWNASYGGVYVQKVEGVETNPYLVELGIDADITLTDGSEMTLRNPSAMTREIGELLERRGLASHMGLTSLDTVNPANAPDDWERSALESFGVNSRESWVIEKDSDGLRQFRYIRPLYVDNSCMECHSSEGYRVGDIRGAISLSIPYENTLRTLNSTRLELYGLAAFVLFGFWMFMALHLTWLQRRVREANSRLERAASMDELTGLWNRRYTIAHLESELERATRKREPLGVMMVDIDHFKRVNDGCGHAAGDEVLRQVSRVLVANVRPYDVVGRFGGEEILVIAPGISLSDLGDMAERLRAGVEALPALEACSSGRVTISVGAAYRDPSSREAADELVSRADGAMYQAKDAGRNRVVTSSEPTG